MTRPNCSGTDVRLALFTLVVVPLQFPVGVERDGRIFALRMVESGESLWAIVRAPRFVESIP